MLKGWDEIPDSLKNDTVKKYYDSLLKKRNQLILKRVFDIIMSLILIIILSPAFIIIAILIKIDSKGTVFYRQERITQYGRTFRIYKFRTMISNADRVGSLVTTQNDNRITRIGSKIRNSRLDELPQLFNIFLGEMCFVGTRPEVAEYVQYYTEEMRATLLLPAGVTSLASIKFKNEDEILSEYVISKGFSINEAYIKVVLPRKMDINIEYLRNFNFLRDIRICFETLGI